MATPSVPGTLHRAQRVLVVGCAGSGKSTVARTLAPRMGLPLIHLDRLFWHPGWVPTAQPEWEAVVSRLSAEPRWLIDGNYARTLPIRLARADLVVWLDLSTATCLWRAIRRALRGRGRPRSDMAPGCPERLDLAFLRWVAGYRRRNRPAMLAWRRAAPASQHWVTLRSPAEVDRFLAALGRQA